MYQFYYADNTLNPEQTLYTKNIGDLFNITAIRPTMWEEHCLECAAPTCFNSCVHYQPRSDGRCKRFYNGIHTFESDNACCGQGARIKFRKWGNMMTIIFPCMLPIKDYFALHKRNERLGKLLGFIESSRLPRTLRWQLIRSAEYLRRRKLRKLSGKKCNAEAFIFHGYSHTQERFNLILEVYTAHTPVFKTSIAILPGENLTVIKDIPASCSQANNTIKIYPENDIEAEIDILWCDFVCGSPITKSTPSNQVKCLIWDLDNTLWNGILIETDDTNSLAINPGVVDLLDEFDSRGILHSIASKNDYDAAWQVLERMKLSEYFLYPQINWGPKSVSIKKISESLNIGIDSLALIDDSAFERMQVLSEFPQVHTYDISELGSLAGKSEFNVTVTEESKKRRSMYKAEEKRTESMLAENADITEFIRKCKLTIQIFVPLSQEEILRCYELTVRTNQLNMTGKKYSYEEFCDILSHNECKNFAFSAFDIFGDYGIVGFGQYRKDHDTLIFSEFAMSCRIAGKFVESALFSSLLDIEGCDFGIFTVQKTKKNSLLRNTLRDIGFSEIEQSDALISYKFSHSLNQQNLVITRYTNRGDTHE